MVEDDRTVSGKSLVCQADPTKLEYQHLRRAARSERFAARIVGESVVAFVGIALVACALGANQRWLDRHFLPVYNVSHNARVLVESFVRVVTAAFGAALALVVRPRVGRLVAHVPAAALLADAARVALAVTLALGASEVALRYMFSRATEEQPANEEPLRRPDQKLGWVFVPDRTGRDTVGGRAIEYAFDSAGYRVRSVTEPVDPERPTVVFSGESMMVGHGLTWGESVPGQVETLLGTQSANLAVHGFANDQAYLRLAAELPRFRRPEAVVSLFTPVLFNRNLDDDRPHLGPGLVWLPSQHHWRLTALARFMVPFRSDETIERGIVVTRDVLRATVDLAFARGAVPLIVVPQFGPEDATERMLRHRILDEAGLSYVWVELDPNWRLPWNWHPDARAAHAIAVAIAARLRRR
jgi:hypothetical protein